MLPHFCLNALSSSLAVVLLVLVLLRKFAHIVAAQLAFYVGHEIVIFNLYFFSPVIYNECVLIS